MTTNEKLIYVENYLKKYFDEMLIKDIRKIRDKNRDEFTFPYILLVSTGIDFLGGLKNGFGDNSSSRSRDFIENWMSRINNLYANNTISELIYKSVRCGASHQAMYKKEIESSSWLYPRDKHLNYMVDFKGKDRIYIHALQFSDDFIKAQELYRKEYIKANPYLIYNNLNNMLNAYGIKDFSNLTQFLKEKGLSFNAEEVAKKNPEVGSINKENSCVKRIDEFMAIPSAAPDLDTTNITRSTKNISIVKESNSNTITSQPELNEKINY